MHSVGPIELVVVLIVAVVLFGPRRKPPVHPVPAGDSSLVRRIRLFHKG